MEVKILHESGYIEALYGLSLSYNKDMERMPVVAERLAGRDGGHNKFLESIIVWIEIDAPRYWWQQFDTYRVGTTKQSQSTMHTLMKEPINSSMFEGEPLSPTFLELLESWRQFGLFTRLKQHLPESFLQRRIVCTNYKVLRNMIIQRKAHRLDEWMFFIKAIEEGVGHPELLPKKE
jgi:hypothetical protein